MSPQPNTGQHLANRIKTEPKLNHSVMAPNRTSITAVCYLNSLFTGNCITRPKITPNTPIRQHSVRPLSTPQVLVPSNPSNALTHIIGSTDGYMDSTLAVCQAMDRHFLSKKYNELVLQLLTLFCLKNWVFRSIRRRRRRRRRGHDYENRF